MICCVFVYAVVASLSRRRDLLLSGVGDTMKRGEFEGCVFVESSCRERQNCATYVHFVFIV